MREIRSPLDGLRSPIAGRSSGPSISILLTGLSFDSLGSYAAIDTHSQISATVRLSGQIVTPDARIWSLENPAGPDKSGAAATFGTGASPTDLAAADDETVWLHVRVGDVWVSRSLAVRREPGQAADLGSQAFVLGVQNGFNVIPTGAGLTFSNYVLTGLPPGFVLTEDGEVNGTPTALGSGVIQGGPEDQYGRRDEYEVTFSWEVTLPAVGTLPAPANQSFTTGSGVQTYQHPAATGAGLTWTYAATGLIAGVTYDAATRTFSFNTGALAQQINTPLGYTATDNFGRPADGSPASFAFSITAIISTQITLSISATLETYTLDLSTVEPAESGSATYAGQSLPAWASVTGNTLTTDARAGTVTVRRTDGSGTRDLILTFQVVTLALTVDSNGDAFPVYGLDDPPGTNYFHAFSEGPYSGATGTWSQGDLEDDEAFWIVPPRIVITSGADDAAVDIGGVITIDRLGLRAYLLGGARPSVTYQVHANGSPISGAFLTGLGGNYTVPSGLTGPLTVVEADGGPNTGVSNAIDIVADATVSLAIIGGRTDAFLIDWEGEELTVSDGRTDGWLIEVDGVAQDRLIAGPQTATLASGGTRSIATLIVTAGQLAPAPGATITATTNATTGAEWSLIRDPLGTPTTVASGTVGTNALTYAIPGGTTLATVYEWRVVSGAQTVDSAEVVVTAAATLAHSLIGSHLNSIAATQTVETFDMSEWSAGDTLKVVWGNANFATSVVFQGVTYQAATNAVDNADTTVGKRSQVWTLPFTAAGSVTESITLNHIAATQRHIAVIAYRGASSQVQFATTTNTTWGTFAGLAPTSDGAVAYVVHIGNNISDYVPASPLVELLDVRESTFRSLSVARATDLADDVVFIPTGTVVGSDTKGAALIVLSVA